MDIVTKIAELFSGSLLEIFGKIIIFGICDPFEIRLESEEFQMIDASRTDGVGSFVEDREIDRIDCLSDDSLGFEVFTSECLCLLKIGIRKEKIKTVINLPSDYLFNFFCRRSMGLEECYVFVKRLVDIYR